MKKGVGIYNTKIVTNLWKVIIFYFLTVNGATFNHLCYSLFFLPTKNCFSVTFFVKMIVVVFTCNWLLSMHFIILDILFIIICLAQIIRIIWKNIYILGQVFTTRTWRRVFYTQNRIYSAACRIKTFRF